MTDTAETPYIWQATWNGNTGEIRIDKVYGEWSNEQQPTSPLVVQQLRGLSLTINFFPRAWRWFEFDNRSRIASRFTKTEYQIRFLMFTIHFVWSDPKQNFDIDSLNQALRKLAPHPKNSS